MRRCGSPIAPTRGRSAFLDAQGKPIGYTIELCERIAQSIERQLGLPSLAIKWVPVDTRTRFEAIVNGTADMECGSTTISLSRLKIVDFSSLIYAESTGVLVKDGRGLFNFDSMVGRKIGVVPGSTNADAIRDQLKQRKFEATLVDFPRPGRGHRGARRAAQSTASPPTSWCCWRSRRRPTCVISRCCRTTCRSSRSAIMLPRGDWAFRLAVNTGLARVFRSGDIIEIYTKYFSTLAPRPSAWIGAVFTFGALPE